MSNSVSTIGHSTRNIEDFISLLRENEIDLLVDIRTIPKSRHNPQFAAESLERSLLGVGITYTHLPGLGGLRHSRKDSINGGWRNESFRGFADYMQTQEFEGAIEHLISIAKQSLAIMCAEAVPWRCHRSLVADALVARGIDVLHIMGVGKVNQHELTSFAKVDGKRIWYPPIVGTLF